jgi:hypothetical protein
MKTETWYKQHNTFEVRALLPWSCLWSCHSQECVFISHELCTTAQLKNLFLIFYYRSLKSKSFLTVAAAVTKLTYRMSVKFMFILLLCKSQTDLLLGWVLWYFLLDGCLISPLDVKWHFCQFMARSLSVTLCRKEILLNLLRALWALYSKYVISLFQRSLLSSWLNIGKIAVG